MIYYVYNTARGAPKIFVDLAGTEKGRFSLCHREAAHINQSLFALKECIRRLASGDAHIPFRQSQLTRLLRTLFVPPALLLFIATLHPAEHCIHDCLDTLRYAEALHNRALPPTPRKLGGRLRIP